MEPWEITNLMQATGAYDEDKPPTRKQLVVTLAILAVIVLFILGALFWPKKKEVPNPQYFTWDADSEGIWEFEESNSEVTAIWVWQNTNLEESIERIRKRKTGE